jgi:predicted anti-sigma-YlaC factor YlaD
MTCKTVNEQLDDFIDDSLNAADKAAFDAHVTNCAECQKTVGNARKLQVLLQAHGETDVPNATAEFFDQTLIRAARSGTRIQHQRSWLRGFGSAIAAGLAVWIIGGLFFSTPEVLDSSVPVVTVALEEPHTVNLVFSSASDLINATLTVILPDGVELSGFEGQREISWETSLTAGRNVLPLKLIATSPQGGELFATLQHDNENRTFRLQVNII